MVDHQAIEAAYDARGKTSREPEDIDILKVFSTLWSGKWFIIAITVMAAVASLAISLSMPNIYRAQALLAPVDDSVSGGLMAIAGQLGGLASLAGVDIDEGKTSKTVIGLEVLKSRSFLSSFIERRQILVPLVAGYKWDHAGEKLDLDPKLYDESTKTWVGFGEGDTAKPSEWKAYAKLISILNVAQSKDSGLITLSVDHPSPVLAKLWVTWLIEDVNEYMREREIEEAQKSIEYLKMELDKTALSDMRQIFFQLIEKQIQRIMLAKVRDEYLFKTIDPPVTPEEKIGPRRASILAISCMVALVFAAALVLMRAAIRNARASAVLQKESA